MTLWVLTLLSYSIGWITRWTVKTATSNRTIHNANPPEFIQFERRIRPLLSQSRSVKQPIAVIVFLHISRSDMHGKTLRDGQLTINSHIPLWARFAALRVA